MRRFEPSPVPASDLEAIAEAARRAPTSWNLQPLHVNIVVGEDEKRRIAEAVSQGFVARAAAVMVFSVDYRKLLEAARRAGVDPAAPGLGHFAVALLDVGIASAWAALAAEEMGYGVVYIALYSNPCVVADALGLPSHVVPVVALALGRPAERPKPRPRQPSRAVYRLGGGYEADSLAEELAQHHGSAVLRHVLGRGGYYEEVGGRLAECLRSRGFEL